MMEDNATDWLYYAQVLGPLAGAFILGMLIGHTVGFNRGLLRGISLTRGKDEGHH